MNIDFTKMKTAEQKEIEAAEAEQDKVNREARDYLAETDWYITRWQETGAPVPDDILVARQEARNRVIE